MGLKVYPDQLFLDIEQAVQGSQILTKKRKFKHLKRPMGMSRKIKRKAKIKKKFYDFDIGSLEYRLFKGGHSRIGSS